MLRPLVYLFLTCSILISCGSDSLAINEAMVMEVIEASEEAIQRGDIDGVMNLLADNVVIEMSMATPRGKQQKTLTREQYRDTLEKSWHSVKDYQYETSDADIGIDPRRNVAVVTQTIHESMTLFGQTVRSKSEETSVIEIIDGKPLVTRISAEINF